MAGRPHHGAFPRCRMQFQMLYATRNRQPRNGATEARIMRCYDELRIRTGREHTERCSEALPVVMVQQFLRIVQKKRREPSALFERVFEEGEKERQEARTQRRRIGDVL